MSNKRDRLRLISSLFYALGGQLSKIDKIVYPLLTFN